MILVYLNLLTEWEVYKFAISGPKSRITRRFQQTMFLCMYECVYVCKYYVFYLEAGGVRLC